jgi:hypothetical protein
MQQHRRIPGARPWKAMLALVVVCLISVTTEPASAQTVRYFDEPLSPYGYWVEDPYYGRVWRPRETPADWRPYTYGRWVYTGDYGWVWVSEEPYGWVVYHYGRWVWTSQYGWVWIAGDVWGPSWVEWCYGGGYVGWAPMPPDPYWQGAAYYGSFDCGSPRYYSRAVFVSETYFASPRVSAHVIVPSQNAVVAPGAVNVTNYTRVGGVIANRSIDVAKLQAATGRPIMPVRVVQAQGPVAPAVGRGPLQELRIYRPPVAAVKAPRLDAAKSPTLNLDPDPKGLSVSPAPLDTGALRPPSLDRPTESLSPPPLSSPSLGGTPVGGALGGGILGRGRR